MTKPSPDLARDAVAIYDAAKAGVEPASALGAVLETIEAPAAVRIFAVGKAAIPMSRAAIAHLERIGREPRGGVLVTTDAGPSPDPPLTRVAGDHPIPGSASSEAGQALAAEVRLLAPGDQSWLLLSGGASSLIGMPIEEISPADYRSLQVALFGAGLPIDRLNAARKRVSRYGAGRLLELMVRSEAGGSGARAQSSVRVFALSDVPSDDPIDIGSGPCEPDPTTAAEIAQLLEAAIGPAGIPPSVARYLERVARGELAETRKPDDPLFERRITRLIATNRMALEHAGLHARALGYDVRISDQRLSGAAAIAGERLAQEVGATPISVPTAWLFGGETTVTLAADAGPGGRCQELALAAARVLSHQPTRPLVVLAAGTDGRDGPTDAAGALVDGHTWSRIRLAGFDPDAALRRHASYPALSSAGALLRTGLTQTNVMDVVVVLSLPA